MEVCRHEAGDVGHVHPEQSTHRMGDVGHPLELDDPGVGRGSPDDQLWPDFAGLGLKGVVVDPLVVLANSISVDLEEAATEVEGHAVGQVAAVGQVHAQDPVARIDRAQVGGHVRLRTRMGLDVDVLGAREELEGPILGESLDHVDVLAAAVVALAGLALGVLVGEPRALRFHDRLEHVVLAGDQLDLVVLAVPLKLHGFPHVGIDLGNRGPPEAGCLAGGHLGTPRGAFMAIDGALPSSHAGPAAAEWRGSGGASGARGSRRDRSNCQILRWGTLMNFRGTPWAESGPILAIAEHGSGP